MYYVYILTTKNNAMTYIGVTNCLEKRVYKHKEKINEGYTRKYNVNKLVYYEEFQYVEDAINREKQLKNWRKEWKINLIKEFNPSFE